MRFQYFFRNVYGGCESSFIRPDDIDLYFQLEVDRAWFFGATSATIKDLLGEKGVFGKSSWQVSSNNVRMPFIMYDPCRVYTIAGSGNVWDSIISINNSKGTKDFGRFVLEAGRSRCYLLEQDSQHMIFVSGKIQESYVPVQFTWNGSSRKAELRGREKDNMEVNMYPIFVVSRINIVEFNDERIEFAQVFIISHAFWSPDDLKNLEGINDDVDDIYNSFVRETINVMNELYNDLLKWRDDIIGAMYEVKGYDIKKKYSREFVLGVYCDTNALVSSMDPLSFYREYGKTWNFPSLEDSMAGLYTGDVGWWDIIGWKKSSDRVKVDRVLLDFDDHRPCLLTVEIDGQKVLPSEEKAILSRYINMKPSLNAQNVLWKYPNEHILFSKYLSMYKRGLGSRDYTSYYIPD